VFATTMVLLYLLHAVSRASEVPREARVPDPRSLGDLPPDRRDLHPFTLGVLRGDWGWTLFGLVWGMAIAGTC
jgi:hemolysin III